MKKLILFLVLVMGITCIEIQAQRTSQRLLCYTIENDTMITVKSDNIIGACISVSTEVGSDSSVVIGSGKTIDGFDVNGVTVYPGESFTPTIDRVPVSYLEIRAYGKVRVILIPAY